MTNRLLTIGYSLLLASPMVAAAEEEEERGRRQHNEELSYSYLEFTNLDQGMNFGGFGVDPDGSRFELGLELGDRLFGVLDRRRSDGDLGGLDFDFESEGYGFGLRGDSWFASYTYNTWDLNNNEFDVDTIRLGFRDRWSDKFEFSASYTWNNLEDLDNEDGYQIGFAYYLSRNLSFVADYETLGGDFDIETVSLGLRLDF